MYRNLESRMAYHGISKKTLAEGTGINYNTLLAKLSGKSSVTLDEAIRIRDYMKESLSIEELFKDE